MAVVEQGEMECEVYPLFIAFVNVVFKFDPILLPEAGIISLLTISSRL